MELDGILGVEELGLAVLGIEGGMVELGGLEGLDGGVVGGGGV